MRIQPGQRRPSVGVAFASWLIAYLAGSLLGAAVVGLSGYSATSEPTRLGESGSPLLGVLERPFSVTVASTVAFWIPLVVMLVVVSRRFGSGRFRDDYALRFRIVDLLGVPVGVMCQLVLLPLLYWPLKALFEGSFTQDRLNEPAQRLTDRADGAWKIGLVLLVVVGAPLIEEIVYRGLIFRSLTGQIADGLAVVVSAAFFALVHLQGVQFPGLFALGVVLAVCLQQTGRLGMGILTHAAFNATTLVQLWRR